MVSSITYYSSENHLLSSWPDLISIAGDIGAESSKAVLQLAQQVEGSGKEEEGQGSVPELLGEPSNALDRRTAQQLQHALEVSNQGLPPF